MVSTAEPTGTTLTVSREPPGRLNSYPGRSCRVFGRLAGRVSSPLRSSVPPPASGLLADPRSGAAARRRFAGPAARRILCQPRHSGPAPAIAPWRAVWRPANRFSIRRTRCRSELLSCPRDWAYSFCPHRSCCLPRFYFCFVTSWLYLWKSRSLEMVSGKPIVSKISTTKEGYRAADTADAWNRTVDFLAKTLKN